MAVLETLVTERGGIVSYRDTDSSVVPASFRGGILALPDCSTVHETQLGRARPGPGSVRPAGSGVLVEGLELRAGPARLPAPGLLVRSQEARRAGGRPGVRPGGRSRRRPRRPPDRASRDHRDWARRHLPRPAGCARPGALRAPSMVLLRRRPGAGPRRGAPGAPGPGAPSRPVPLGRGSGCTSPGPAGLHGEEG
jgi:hypothetical protein